jgi:hypothetical protein
MIKFQILRRGENTCSKVAVKNLIHTTQLVYVWYHGEYVRLTVSQCDFAEAIWVYVAFDKSR